MNNEDTHLHDLPALALAEVGNILAALPPPLQEMARRIPVIYEWSTSQRESLRDLGGNTLGLFVGPPLAETESEPGVLAAHIVLILDTIWAEAGRDEAGFRKEVRTTFLHELGHYLGLDEDQLTERGL